MEKKYKHIPVLLNETINSLNIKENGVYIDATFGSGGHSRLLLSKLNKFGKLYAIDCDKQAILNCNIKDNRFKIFHCNFSSIIKIIKEFNLIGKINGIILDCGVSSIQIDDPKRGFSFIKNGLLDMRMNQFSKNKTAYTWLLKTNIKELNFVIKKYGEERFSKRIANAIIKRNQSNNKIFYTKDLSDLICSLIPIKNKKFKNSATRTFQAIRIHINNELEEIKKILQDSLKFLSPLGRLSVISFHSLENRIVKKFINKNSMNCNLINKIPLTELEIKNNFNTKKLKFIGKIFPSKKEIKDNIRSRSAILRIAEKNIKN